MASGEVALAANYTGYTVCTQMQLIKVQRIKHGKVIAVTSARYYATY
jgi:hypothetical protein